MIRCYPIDGSEPFEVHGWHDAKCGNLIVGASLAADWSAPNGEPFVVCGKHCRIESWRERAERLEHEIARLTAEDSDGFCVVCGRDRHPDSVRDRD